MKPKKRQKRIKDFRINFQKNSVFFKVLGITPLLIQRTLFFILLSFWSFNIVAQTETKQIDSLIEVANNMPSSAEKVKAYYNLGYKYRSLSVPTAKEYLLKAVKLGNEINELKYSINSLGQLALIYANATMMDSTDYFLDMMLNLAKKENTPVSWSYYYQIKMIIVKKSNDFKQAEVYAEKALEYALKDNAKNTESVAGAYLNLANAMLGLKKYEHAIENFYKALKIFDEIKNEKGISFCYNNLATIYMELNQQEDAKSYIKKSIALKKKVPEYILFTVSQRVIFTCPV